MASPCTPRVPAGSSPHLAQSASWIALLLSSCLLGFTLQLYSAFLDMGLITRMPWLLPKKLSPSNFRMWSALLQSWGPCGPRDPVSFVGSPALILPQSPEMSFYLVLEAKFPLVPSLTDGTCVLFLGIHFCYDNAPVNAGLPACLPALSLEWFSKFLNFPPVFEDLLPIAPPPWFCLISPPPSHHHLLQTMCGGRIIVLSPKMPMS